MQINVGAYIAELLYGHPSVAIPGLGSFTSNYKSASIDHVQGKVQPPSLQLQFSAHLTLDDGLLLEGIKKKYQLDMSQARKELEQFVADTKAALERREIVTIPQVGRLYLDYENHLQFLQEGNNFNVDAFGLPTVQFLPVKRSEAVASAPVNTSVSGKTTTPVAIAHWFQRNVLWLGSLTFVLVLSGIYLVFIKPPQTSGGNPAANNKLPTPVERINISPTSQAPPEEENASLSANAEENSANVDLDTEEATLPPGQQSCIILIGKFGNENNIKRLVQRLYEEGYEPYTENKNKLTLVGVQFTYDSDKEVQRTLSAIRKKFDKRAQVIKR